MRAGEDETPTQQFAHALARVLRDGALAALATVVSAPTQQETHATPEEKRATHLRVGAKLLVEESGTRAGTTGDFALDEAVAAHAEKFLSSRMEARTFRVEEFAHARRELNGARDESSAAREEWRGVRVMFERVEPEPHVVVCGAGHVGAALARLASAIGYRVTLIDDREDFVAPERFAGTGVKLVAASNWTEPVAEAVGTGRGVSVAVVTRGHNEDEECMRAVLRARPDYVGMIGSRRRTNIVLERLRESGFDGEELREVRAPVGLDIGSVSPEEVALSILAEIVAHRRGGTGRPLSTWRRE
ncbi:MAG TPA: XdhC/CoxI family protein [Pyrinomonadaceae bacterium]|nr:XdhC/CoxI family protein [Pyrinomonadaceae bacterium]